MRKEILLRLIKDNKIVGYMWITAISPCSDLISVNQSVSLIFDRNLPNNDLSIEYDSFELGIKVNKKYLFEGDKGTLFFAGKEREVTLLFDDYQFVFATEGKGFYSFPEYKNDFKLR